jgi:DNA polymerase-3 subunit gamma/tau
MSLDIKYRPKTFDEVVSNKTVVSSLKALDDTTHTILLSGPSGCGKTTLARIIASKLNCKNIIEMNLSDFRGIDAARSIINELPLLPTQGKTKVLILDECHAATKDFQNCILKSLEEPPNHVYFVLCTTEPEKLLKTIKTRCKHFQVQSLKTNQLLKLLVKVCNKENIEIESDDLKLIASESDGCARLALHILEQCKDIDNKSSLIKQIKTVESSAFELAQKIFNGSWADVVGIMEKLDLTDSNIERIRRTVLSYAYKCALKKEMNDNVLYALFIITCFKTPFFNSGKAGLIEAIGTIVQPD